MKILVCRCFFVAVVGTVPLVVLMKLATALIVRSASEIAGALQCADLSHGCGEAVGITHVKQDYI